ncbi:OstA-like protein [Candidatus Cardinium hertigii]|uniref:OstA-like protein n=1 Tax=Candidatus Cardinium hertigii TaxID=247481 RepID=UPI003D7CC909
MCKRIIYFAAYLLTFPLSIWAEAMTYKADRLESDVIDNKPCKKLEGNVVFTFHTNGMVLTADKAYKYDDQELIKAQGNVKIMDQEGNVVESVFLTYDLLQKRAVFEKNVRYLSRKATFYTPKLIYDVEKKQGKFLQGGKLVQDQMVLTSSMGLYDGAHHQVTFCDKVVLVDPSYTFHSDQLDYKTESEVAYFRGPTKIIYRDGVFKTPKGGYYSLPKKQLAFEQGVLTTENIRLAADHLEIVNGEDCAATGHVSLHSQKHDALITGGKASYTRKEKKSVITDSPLLTKVLNNETIYLRADTFIFLEKNEPPEQEVHALNHVRLYQEVLQGVADGAVYNTSKNTIYLHNKPIIWCGQYQITGEAVHLAIEEGEHVRMFVDKNLFMASENLVGHYNQVKGNKLVGLFKEGVIEKMSISGNSESIYFALGDNNELVGMNHLKCNGMEMNMVDNTLAQMTCQPKPIGVFYPAESLKEAQMKLPGFVWFGEKWPTKANILEGLLKDVTDQNYSGPKKLDKK